MPKPNYAFEKRQRELEAKRKKQEKAVRKTRPASDDAPGHDAQQGEAAPADGAAVPGSGDVPA